MEADVDLSTVTTVTAAVLADEPVVLEAGVLTVAVWLARGEPGEA